MRTKVKLLLAAGMCAAVLAPVAASAGGAKVDVCHVNGQGDYHLININENAFATHVEHGDAALGDAVPGMVGYVFGDGCAAELAAVDSASGNLTVLVNGTGDDRYLQFDTATGTVSWQADDATFDADVTSFTVTGNNATIYGTVTSNSTASGASPGDTFTFTVTDASTDLVYWEWLTGPTFTGPFTVVGGDLAVFDADAP